MMMLLLVVVSALLETGATRYSLSELTEVYTTTKVNTSEILSVESFKTKGASWNESSGV